MKRRMIAGALIGLSGACAAAAWARTWETRVATVEPDAIYRGAWQSPEALRGLLARYQIRTIVTLTAINQDDPKYVSQQRVVKESGVDWIVVPMRGSTATLEQLDEAVALIGDRARQPVFFHCVGGHHRSNLVHAAYLMKRKRRSGAQAWAAVAALPWTRPTADRDRQDHEIINQYEHTIAR